LCDYDRKRVKNANGNYICESTCLVDTLLWEAFIIYEETNTQQYYDPACKYCKNAAGTGWDDYCSVCDLKTGKCLQCLDWQSSNGFTYAVSPDGYCEEVRCPAHCDVCNHNTVSDTLECLYCQDGWTLNMASQKCEQTQCPQG